MTINFISSKAVDEECVMHTKSDNKEFIAQNDANEFVRELFESLRSKHQGNLETSMEGIIFNV